LIPEAIEEAITPRTRGVVTVSPNNPSGAVYSESSLRAVNEICRRHGIYHISDEAYEYFTYGTAKHFSPGSISGSNRYTISLYSLSKAYGFASWRVGYIVLPRHLYAAMEKVQDVVVICPPGISQYAALGALNAGRAYCRKKIQELAEVREVIFTELERIKELCTVFRTDGAFYLLVRVRTDLDPMVLVERLVREYGVGVIPGTSFGLEDKCYLRISYGCLNLRTVAEGMGRLGKGLKKLIRA
jgi:aspartate/methionine/tyrosine aminotransferase